MIYTPSPLAVIIFIFFVLTVLGLSFYLARKTTSSKHYFAAGGTIPWAVNGIAFAGDYLSAASFLGICGMIAVAGYDGFLYSIGYLAGWIVAMFVIAEPFKRIGKYTFTDALDSKFQSKGIQLMAGISTLIVSLFYLIPQMVGAGALVTPLLGLPHWVGVMIVGGIVILIVSTAGMKSTTYVQFLKGSLLVIFSLIVVIFVLLKGIQRDPYPGYHDFESLEATVSGENVTVPEAGYRVTSYHRDGNLTLVELEKEGIRRWWQLEDDGSNAVLRETLSITEDESGTVLYNGEPKANERFYPVGHVKTVRHDGKEVEGTGPIGPFKFFSTLENSEVVRFPELIFQHEGSRVRVWYQKETPGERILRPGLKFKVDEGATTKSKLNFISLMMALFFGTAALPHILIRYYTVPTPRDARKSTIVAIATIGFFYILTLYLGLGAMINGVIDVESSNMSAPLLARSFGPFLFSIISAVAFATVLGTVSGLIVASSGAVAHDFISNFLGKELSDRKKVLAGKIAAVVVGIIAILLGIVFKGMNVAYLVGWAFAVAASANLPSIIMLLFWKKTTAKGIIASITTGIVSSLGIILLSPDMFVRYGLDASRAPMPIDNPGIISIPLSFIVLVIVSLLTQSENKNRVAPAGTEA